MLNLGGDSPVIHLNIEFTLHSPLPRVNTPDTSLWRPTPLNMPRWVITSLGELISGCHYYFSSWASENRNSALCESGKVRNSIKMEWGKITQQLTWKLKLVVVVIFHFDMYFEIFWVLIVNYFCLYLDWQCSPRFGLSIHAVACANYTDFLVPWWTLISYSPAGKVTRCESANWTWSCGFNSGASGEFLTAMSS